MSQFVRFTIDGTECMATRGQYLVDAAKENGIYVPTLCNYPGVKPKGSCRICTVRVNGKFMTACTTPVAEGMNIESEVKDIVNCGNPSLNCCLWRAIISALPVKKAGVVSFRPLPTVSECLCRVFRTSSRLEKWMLPIPRSSRNRTAVSFANVVSGPYGMKMAKAFLPTGAEVPVWKWLLTPNLVNS